MPTSYDQSVTEITENVTAAVGAVSEETAKIIDSIVNTAASEAGGNVKVDNYTPGQAVSDDVVVLNVAAGTELAGQNVGGKVIVMNEDTSANVVFTADAATTAMVVGGKGNSDVTFETDQAVAVTLQGGAGDKVSVGNGNNTITTQGGEAEIAAGNGDNTLVLNSGQAKVEAGDGANVITFTASSADDAADIKVGGGDNQITFQTGAGGTANIDAGSGSNTINLVGGGTANVNAGHGDNTITFTGNDTGGTANIKAGGGNNNVTFNAGDGGKAAIQLGDTGSTGNNTVTLQGVGDSTVVTGDGNDSINLQGEGTANIKGGSGNMVIALQNDSLTATIDAGDGFDQLTLHSARHAHTFFFDLATRLFQMHSQPVTMTGVNVVTFDNNGDGALNEADQATVLAQTPIDSTIALLYKVALGRDPFDNPADYADHSALGGIDWWMNQFDENLGMDQMIATFLNCPEFGNKYGAMDNTNFVANMFDNLNAEAIQNGRAQVTAINGHDAAWFVDQMNQGLMSQTDVAKDFVQSAEAIQLLGINGVQYVIDGFGEA